MDKKLCDIEDIIPVKVYSTSPRKVIGPIRNVLLTNAEIFTILNSIPSPKHMYAIDEKTGRKILLTKSNYNKSVEDLFGNIVKDEPKKTEVKIPMEQPVVVKEEVTFDEEIEEPQETTEESATVDEDTVTDNEVNTEDEAVETPVQSYKSYKENKKKHRR